MDPNELSQRTKSYALNIIKFFQNLPKTEESRILGKQLLRSATSVAANYRAARRSRSKNELIAKISIVVEESDEALFWLELIHYSGIADPNSIALLKKEAEELLFIFSASRKTAKNNIEEKA
ncbi:MAG: four helix bundle protein [Bacteroidales bacterium]|nr:four helix bundle protein [Bacteroidales bacterium]